MLKCRNGRQISLAGGAFPFFLVHMARCARGRESIVEAKPLLRCNGNLTSDRSLDKFRYMDFDLERILDPEGIGNRAVPLEHRRIRKGPVVTLHPPPEFKYKCDACGDSFWTCTRPHHWVSRQQMPVCRTCRDKVYNEARKAARAERRRSELAGRTCDHCGEPLPITTKRRQFCGVRCRVAHHREKERI